jgi:hypothetical protein
VIEEAGLSNKGLASRVRAEATKIGHDASPGHQDVKRWLDGVKPRVETARCIAAALSAKLGRKVSLAEIGFDSPQDDATVDLMDEGAHYQSTPERSIVLLDSLADADLADRRDITNALWVPTATPSIITGYLVGGPLSEDLTLASVGDVATAERIRSTVRHLMDLDFQFGGGHVRKLLLFFWKSEIVPALRESYPEPIRREIFSAAADAAEMVGWSAYDAGRHGAAQRYFVQGLRLAREANDRLKGGHILADLSHQANYLGHFDDAVKLARSAQLVTGGSAPATVASLFLAMEARGLASLGDASACAAVLHRAEQTFDRSNPDEDPEWISFFDSLELAGEASHCFRDLGKPEETERFTAQAIDPKLTPPRTRAFISMVRADGALAGGNMDQAVSLATEAINLAGSLQSDRYLVYVANFYRSLTAKHAAHPLVRAFTDLVRESYPTLELPGAA